MAITAKDIAEMLVNPHCSIDFVIQKIRGKWRPREQGKSVRTCLQELMDIYTRTYGDQVSQSQAKSANLLVADVNHKLEPVN